MVGAELFRLPCRVKGIAEQEERVHGGAARREVGGDPSAERFPSDRDPRGGEGAILRDGVEDGAVAALEDGAGIWGPAPRFGVGEVELDGDVALAREARVDGRDEGVRHVAARAVGEDDRGAAAWPAAGRQRDHGRHTAASRQGDTTAAGGELHATMPDPVRSLAIMGSKSAVRPAYSRPRRHARARLDLRRYLG